MIVGLLSDSHGRVETTRAAVKLLTEHHAHVLLHLGDIGSEAVLDELVGHNARVVFGNCDWDTRGLSRHAQCMGILVDDPIGRIEVAGKTIAYTHGHHAQLIDEALREGVDYLLHGHTHEVRDERIGRTRVINPGALQRAARYTVGLLDPVTDELRIREVLRTA